MPRLADRNTEFLTFHAVEIFKRAHALQAAGHDIISLGIGEPDFTAPPQVVETLERAARAGLSGYSPPAGVGALREAIADPEVRQLPNFGAADQLLKSNAVLAVPRLTEAAWTGVMAQRLWWE